PQFLRQQVNPKAATLFVGDGRGFNYRMFEGAVKLSNLLERFGLFHDMGSQQGCCKNGKFGESWDVEYVRNDLTAGS
ncbi:MAG: hypothetical protein ACKORJ_03860, partial [Bacteroidota bacterium]